MVCVLLARCNVFFFFGLVRVIVAPVDVWSVFWTPKPVLSYTRL